MSLRTMIMAAAVETPSTPAPQPDPSNVNLLLHFDGTNGETSTTDSSDYGRIVTLGSQATISDLQAKFGETSLRFAGADSVQNQLSCSGFSLPSSSDYCIEGFIRPTSNPSTGTNVMMFGQLGNATNGRCIRVTYSAGQVVKFIMYNSDVNQIVLDSVDPVPINQWTHVAVNRTGNTLRLFINGKLQAQSVYTGINTTQAVFTLGRLHRVGTSFYPFSGFIDDVRVTVGESIYTENFTVPKQPFPNP